MISAALVLNIVDLQAVARLSALRLADSLVEGTIIAIFAALAVRAHRRDHAGTRFSLWFSALMAVAVVPLLSAWMTHTGVARALLPASPATALTLHHPAITLPDSWALYLFAAWALIAAWFLFGIARSLWHLRKLRKTCTPLDPATLASELQETLQHAENRRARLCLSDQVRVPTVLGLWKPAIVFPRWAMHELSPAELNQILLHELAHLRRYDDWTNLAQQLVRAVFFFHPAVWWIEGRVSLEREIACDDAVIAATHSARSYAECLAHLAEKTFVQRSVALAQAAIGKMRQVSTRVAQILDSDRSTNSAPRWRTAATLVTGLAVVFAVAASTSHELIAFQPAGSQAIATNTAPDFSHSLRESDHSNFNTDRVIAESEPTSATVPVVPASWKFPVAQRRAAIHRRNTQPSTSPKQTSPNRTPQPSSNSLVHLTSFDPAMLPYAETVFLVIRSEQIGSGQVCSEDDQPVIQIQMWQVLVFHPPVDENKLSHKEI
jgi:beta-lactamase regulating signal transducer with metallopeptidase domain